MAPESDKGQVVMQENPEVSTDSAILPEDKEGKDNDKEERDKEKAKDSDKEKGKEKDAERRGEIEKDKTKGLDGTNLEAMLHRLPSCVSRDLIDQLTVKSFVFLLEHFSIFSWLFLQHLDVRMTQHNSS